MTDLQLSTRKTFMPDVNVAQLVWSLWEFVLYNVGAL